MDISGRLVDWIVGTNFRDIPGEAIKIAKVAVLDSLGVALAGRPEECGRIAVEFVRGIGAKPEAIVLGSGFRSSAQDAAFANGIMMHALDFDDTNHPGQTHPSACLTPTVLALGEVMKASGADILAAYVIGFDVEVKLGRAINPTSYQRGWHSTSTQGVLGSAAAAAKLLGLDAHKTRMALAIAASEAAGLRQNFGTMGKPFHPGNAARGGIVAARLADMGFTGAKDALEGEFGWCNVFAGKDPIVWNAITDGLSKVWEVAQPIGHAVKPYPSCGTTHPSLEATLDLVNENNIKPQDVTAVRVGIIDWAPKILAYHTPQTGLEGKFSMEYCLAAAIIDRKVGFEQFTDAKVGAPVAQGLLRKVKYYHPPELSDNREWGARITIETKSGRKYEKQVDLAKGKVCRPMSNTELLDKFRMCAGFSLKPAKTEAAIKLLQSLDNLKDIVELCNILKGRP